MPITLSRQRKDMVLAGLAKQVEMATALMDIVTKADEAPEDSGTPAELLNSVVTLANGLSELAVQLGAQVDAAAPAASPADAPAAPAPPAPAPASPALTEAQKAEIAVEMLNDVLAKARSVVKAKAGPKMGWKQFTQLYNEGFAKLIALLQELAPFLMAIDEAADMAPASDPSGAAPGMAPGMADEMAKALKAALEPVAAAVAKLEPLLTALEPVVKTADVATGLVDRIKGLEDALATLAKSRPGAQPVEDPTTTTARTVKRLRSGEDVAEKLKQEGRLKPAAG